MAPGLSVWLQKYLNLFLGPFLILVGMILLELLELPTGSGSGLNRLRTHVEKLGLAGSGLLGILFALSFCPVSAALFFGSLIPLAIANESKVLLPAVYGIGTGIPVIVFAVMLVFGKTCTTAVFEALAIRTYGRYSACKKQHAGVAQLVRALDCGSRGPPFKSERWYHYSFYCPIALWAA